MATVAMKAGVRAFVRLMDLDYSADTIDRFFSILRLIPKDQLERRSLEIRDIVEGKEMPEEEFLEILKAWEQELTTSSTPSPKTT